MAEDDKFTQTVSLEDLVIAFAEHINNHEEQPPISDNHIDITIGSEGCSVSMHTNELTFEELKEETREMLKALSQNEKQPHDDHDVR